MEGGQKRCLLCRGDHIKKEYPEHRQKLEYLHISRVGFEPMTKFPYDLLQERLELIIDTLLYQA